MTSGSSPGRAAVAAVRRIQGDRRATAALEFAIIGLPFFYILLGILQMGIYYMAQAALDDGVSTTASNLRNSFNTGTAPSLPTGSTLKSNIVSNSGGIIANTSSLAVDMRALTTLDTGAVPITDGTVDSVTTSVPIVLRAQFHVMTVAPGFPLSMTVASAAILRFSSF